MTLIPASKANELARANDAAWIELASARGAHLERALGRGELGEHLPGLGEIVAWGIVDASDLGEVTGAICTGFLPDPESVSVLLSARRDGSTLSLASLDPLLRLPRSVFSRFALRSFVTEGVASRLTHDDALVLETRSKAALDLAQRLLEHLVGRRGVVASVQVHERPPFYVDRNTDSLVHRHTERPQESDHWQVVEDWSGAFE